MFGRALFVSDDGRWDTASMPLAWYEMRECDAAEVRDELKKLFPGKEEEIDRLDIRLWVFTHHS